MPLNGKPPAIAKHKVFISYCSEENGIGTPDSRVAAKICSTLESQGILCWIAPRNILPGADWMEAITDAIDDCKIVILVFSANTEKSKWVRDEIKLAMDGDKTIIPFRIQEVYPQRSLKLLKVSCQWLHAFTPPMEPHIQRLVDVVRDHLGLNIDREQERPETEKKDSKKAEQDDTSGKIGTQHKVDNEPQIKKVYQSSVMRPDTPKSEPNRRVRQTTGIHSQYMMSITAILIIFSIFVIGFILSQMVKNGKSAPGGKELVEAKGTDTQPEIPKNEVIGEENKAEADKKPDYVHNIEVKGWEVNKNNLGFWEAFDKNYGITMIYIPAGEFTMGSQEVEDDEKPPHQVYLDGYWMGKYEVTIRQYLQFARDTGSHFPKWLEKGNEYNIETGTNDYYKEFVADETCPVVGIYWKDAMAYCDWLSQQTGLKFKLPTEAQWEQAARGTDGRPYPWGDREPDGTLANFNYNIRKTTPVGSYPSGASPYGLLDMAGNVWEWCRDWYDEDYYANSPQKNPMGPASGSFRVIRGGGWYDYAGSLHCAYRFSFNADVRDGFLGFRLSQDL